MRLQIWMSTDCWILRQSLVIGVRFHFWICGEAHQICLMFSQAGLEMSEKTFIIQWNQADHWSVSHRCEMWIFAVSSAVWISNFMFSMFPCSEWWLANESPSVKTLLSRLQSEEKVGKEWPELLAPLFRLGFSTNTSISTNNYTSTIFTKTESTTLGNKGCRWGEGQRGTVGS